MTFNNIDLDQPRCSSASFASSASWNGKSSFIRVTSSTSFSIPGNHLPTISETVNRCPDHTLLLYLHSILDFIAGLAKRGRAAACQPAPKPISSLQLVEDHLDAIPAIQLPVISTDCFLPSTLAKGTHGSELSFRNGVPPTSLPCG